MLGDDLAAELPRLRAEAESSLADHGSINRVSRTLDRDTGVLVDTYEPVWSGPMSARQREAMNRVDSADSEVTAAPIVVRTPWDTPADPDMVVILDVSADPRLLNRPLQISSVEGGTWSVWRRLDCTEVQGADPD